MHQTQIALKSVSGEDCSGKSVLDIGCSNGQLSLLIMKTTKADSLVGVDFDAERINKARQFIQDEKTQKVSFKVASADNLNDFANNSIDRIFCNMAFQQFKNPDKSLKEMYRVLKSEGVAIINFNAEKSPVYIQQEIIFNKLFGDSAKQVSKKKGISDYDMENGAKKAGFNKTDIKIEDNVFYYQSPNDVADNIDRSFFAESKKLNENQNKTMNEELDKYLLSIKTDKGIPESWKICFAKLYKNGQF